RQSRNPCLSILSVACFETREMDADSAERLADPLSHGQDGPRWHVALDALGAAAGTARPFIHVGLREAPQAADQLGPEGLIGAQPPGVMLLQQVHREGCLYDGTRRHGLAQDDRLAGRRALIAVPRHAPLGLAKDGPS